MKSRLFKFTRAELAYLLQKDVIPSATTNIFNALWPNSERPGQGNSLRSHFVPTKLLVRHKAEGEIERVIKSGRPNTDDFVEGGGFYTITSNQANGRRYLRIDIGVAGADRRMESIKISIEIEDYQYDLTGKHGSDVHFNTKSLGLRAPQTREQAEKTLQSVGHILKSIDHNQKPDFIKLQRELTQYARLPQAGDLTFRP